MIEHKKLTDLITYNPDTGIFRLRVDHNNKKAGSILSTPHTLGYIFICFSGKRYLAHRLAWFYAYGRWPKDQIDHINQNKKDNRLSNLREATNSKNHQNKKSYNRSGFKGVSIANGGRYKRKKWYARIKLNGKQFCLGTFDTPEEAHIAYVKAAERLFGEFKCTNTRN